MGAAALAGYTAAIVAADTLGATGGASSQVFMLSIFRASEICIGIACAGIVLAASDLGGAQKRLAVSFADLAADIAGGFTSMLAAAGSQLPDTQAERSELVRRVIELDHMIDQALGESSHLRDRSTTLQTAVHGLFAALVGWRGIAAHLRRLPDDVGDRAVESMLPGTPAELRSASEPNSSERWIADPVSLQHVCKEGEQTLLTLKTDTPSRRMLADETAKVLRDIACVLDGLALLVDAPGRTPAGNRNVSPGVADWLRAVVNGIRAFVTTGAVEVLWVVTAWPNGGAAIVFVTIVLLLLSPKGDLAYLGALAFALTAAFAIVVAAILEFAVLPAVETFPAFCAAIGLFFIPVGFAAARSQTPALMAVFGGFAVVVMRLLSPTNPMIYNTAQFYNTALAIFVGAPSDRWHFVCCRHFRPRCGRGGCLLSPCAIINHLRKLLPRFWAANELGAALASFAQGNSTVANARLHQLDCRPASDPGTGLDTDDAFRVRGRIGAMIAALAEHGSFFDWRAPT